MIELWTQVTYRGRLLNYDVSHTGKVRNRASGKILKPWLRGQRKGTYPAIGLYNKGERFFVDVHRLTALHFGYNPRPSEKCEVDHFDQDHLNSSVWNTEWVSRQENESYKIFPALRHSSRCLLKDREEMVAEYKKYGDAVPF